MRIRSRFATAALFVTTLHFSLVTAATGAETNPHDAIGAINFYGYQGLDLAKVRAALPVRVGDPITNQTKKMIEAAIADAIGSKPTQVATVCCDATGRTLVYIGLQGGTYQPVRHQSDADGKRAVADGDRGVGASHR